MLTSHTTGLFGYSTRGDVAVELANLEKIRGDKMVKLGAASLAEIEKDPALLALARARGKTVFGDNCAPCHGSGGAGAKGYPNLNDDEWLWGGSLDQILQTIQFGVRSGHAKAHESAMLAFGKEGVLKKDQIVTAANYVRSLSGLSTGQGIQCERGRQDLRRELRVLSRRRRQGKSGTRRARPHGQDLALRFRRGHPDRNHRQRPRRRDAGLGGASRSLHDQGAGGLRPLARRREVTGDRHSGTPGLFEVDQLASAS